MAAASAVINQAVRVEGGVGSFYSMLRQDVLGSVMQLFVLYWLLRGGSGYLCSIA